MILTFIDSATVTPMCYNADASLEPIEKTITFNPGDSFLVEDAGDGLFEDHFWYIDCNARTKEKVGLVILVDEDLVELSTMEFVDLVEY